jgi:hypothetical protein
VLFQEIGVKKIRQVGPNMMLGSAFGLRVSGADPADAEHLRDVFANEKGVSPAVVTQFDPLHLSRVEGSPNLIIFVGPKPPEPMTFTIIPPLDPKAKALLHIS